ncbi:MAG: hypothetical protein COU90_01380 [Candidatus Ryanbacteria bacterium CG10_big_fil_rev_8_21_14_0_10_43_42]|uniref:HAD family hydrolase n=1 Tax=Candidatus Ryanbacteria bacterium CG10_big_fil_rev_8_21_14_0_10_43_42 TaxID=1974864 RepID=A0A2M8KXN2_9BACT|nr:MAG: hypothetical protein COU90_01380 [Candidatus Ryanbacteria bacterium CG10_big_fil_rev_8_21_14_0_10_43_42]
MPKDIILLVDFDGTLACTLHLGECVRLAFAEQGFEVEDNFVEKFHGNNFSAFVTEYYPNLDVDSFKKSVTLHETQKNNGLYEGVLDMLLCWKNLPIRLCLFTARDECSVESRLDNHGIRHFFDVVCTSDHYYPLGKSDVGSMEMMLGYYRERNIDGTFWYVGDSYIDFLSAKNNGIGNTFFRAVVHGDVTRRDELINSGVPEELIINHPSEMTLIMFPELQR